MGQRIRSADYLITKPAASAEQFDGLPEGKRKGIENRDAKQQNARQEKAGQKK